MSDLIWEKTTHEGSQGRAPLEDMEAMVWHGLGTVLFPHTLTALLLNILLMMWGLGLFTCGDGPSVRDCFHWYLGRQVCDVSLL